MKAFSSSRSLVAPEWGGKLNFPARLPLAGLRQVGAFEQLLIGAWHSYDFEWVEKEEFGSPEFGVLSIE